MKGASYAYWARLNKGVLRAIIFKDYKSKASDWECRAEAS